MMISADWDPNTLFTSVDEPKRIYGGDPDLSIFAKVDEEDYYWAIQWRWSPKKSRGGKKIYLRRNIHVRLGPDYRCDETGNIIRNRLQQNLFLHVAIIQRAGLVPPTEKHVIVDHRNGDGLDCRRENLRWATRSQNNKNINGKFGAYMGDF